MKMESLFIILFLLTANWLQWIDRKKLRQERDIYRGKCDVKHTQTVLFDFDRIKGKVKA